MTAFSTEVPRNTRKTGLLAALVLLAACGGLYAAYDAEHITINGMYNPPITRLIGIGGAILMAALGVLLIKQWRSTGPGLELKEEGFIDNTSGAAAGLVAWEDITGLQEVKVGFTRFIAVLLRDPAKYIGRPAKAATRQLFANYHQLYGSPVLLSTSMLHCSLDELRNLLAARIRPH